jgi:hypothetical protein
MTPQQASDFQWTGTSNTYLNRDTGYFGFPTPPTGVSPQYVSFEFDSLLYQNINVPTKGKYALTLFHCKRPGFSILGLDIILDDILVTTIPSTIPSTWTFFRIEFTITYTGSQILKFIQPNNTGNDLAITNVSLVGLDLLSGCGTTYLPPLNFNQGKLFNIEDYEYQDKPIALRSGDERYLKSNTNINHNGDLYVDGNLTSRMFLSQPSNYFTNTTSNIQQQINDMSTKNLGGGYWTILAEGTVSTATNTGYNFSFGASLTTTNLYSFICADANLIGIGISHATSVTSAITIGIFLASSTTSKYNIAIPVTASAGRQFALDLTSQNITFIKGNYFRLRTTAGAGAGATRNFFKTDHN